MTSISASLAEPFVMRRSRDASPVRSLHAADRMGLLTLLRVPLSWSQVFKRVAVTVYHENSLGWAAELAYFGFLALFPALLFFVALASFFPIRDFTPQIVDALAPVAPAEVLE